jgi:hypothetical protein
MVQSIAEGVIYFAAGLAVVAGVAFLVYIVSLVVWERHEHRASLADHRRQYAARRAPSAPEPQPEAARSSQLRGPAPYPRPAQSAQHHA